MSFFVIFLLLVVSLLGIYALMLLDLNKTIINLDLFFLEIDLELGYIILISTLSGICIALVLEIIFFSSRRKKKDE
tara:strand:+ start:567 stop:794 length:228 start_codon:yes stop_codon:yes gene_type:complete